MEVIGVSPDSIQPVCTSVLRRLKFGPTSTTLLAVRVKSRLLCQGLGIVTFLASCLINVGCAGVSSGSSASHVSVLSSGLAVSGTISPAANGSGATVTLSGAASTTTTADASGNYSFSALVNGSYTITPSKTGFAFGPSSKSVTINGANVAGVSFSAAPDSQSFSMSGTISPAANGSGATVTLSGAASTTTTADASGNYSFSTLGNGSYTITPSKAGFAFGPSSQAATV